MKTFRLLAATALTFAALPLSAQPTATFDPARLSQHVQTLGSDAFEGRAPATNGEVKTVDYISKQLAAAGVQPGGDLVNGQRQWTQAVPLLRSEWSANPRVGATIAGKAAKPKKARKTEKPEA